MSKLPAIFLSAGVPDPARDRRFYDTADSVAIRAAVVGLVRATASRRRIVWGGQPGIAPMLSVAAHAGQSDHNAWITLYLSAFFEQFFPPEVGDFEDRIVVKAVPGDREKSLLEMRRRMFTEHTFSAAVFIGGMEGVIDEFKMLKELQPDTLFLPLASTGGAAREIYNSGNYPTDLSNEAAYFSLFKKYFDRAV